jgi:hypothetical protein
VEAHCNTFRLAVDMFDWGARFHLMRLGFTAAINKRGL